MAGNFLLDVSSSSYVDQETMMSEFNIRIFQKVLQAFREIDPEMQAQTIMTFAIVMQRPGIPMRDLQDELGVASSSTSRNVAYLSDVSIRGRRGHGLVMTQEDPVDRRYKLVFLTLKGRRFAEKIKELCSDGRS